MCLVKPFYKENSGRRVGVMRILLLLICWYVSEGGLASRLLGLASGTSMACTPGCVGWNGCTATGLAKIPLVDWVRWWDAVRYNKRRPELERILSPWRWSYPLSGIQVANRRGAGPTYTRFPKCRHRPGNHWRYLVWMNRLEDLLEWCWWTVFHPTSDTNLNGLLHPKGDGGLGK